MSSPTWQLQDARDNLSRLIKLASSGVAQTVTVRGKPVVVIVSTAEVEKLTRPAAGSLSKLLRKPGLAGDDLKIEREKESGRLGRRFVDRPQSGRIRSVDAIATRTTKGGPEP